MSVSLTSLRALRNASRHSRVLHASSQLRFASYDHLQKDLPARKLPLVYDYLVPTPSHLLNIALGDILPSAATVPNTLPTTTSPAPLPHTHHLIYFPPPIRGADLLPDGTDPLQSPGEPFVRRMWAGGSVRFNNSPNAQNLIRLAGQRTACLESIRDVSIKGKEGSEKIFVGIERRVGSVPDEDEPEDSIRQRLWQDDEADFGDSVSVIERRNIVFMRERSKEQAVKDMAAAKEKQMAPPSEGPDYTATVDPDAKLLFRYSALTYNAHAIHLDPEYCRTVEGHRGMLVHGPLSFTLLVTLLRQQLQKEGKGEEVKFVEYRNLAPLYCHEPLKLNGRRTGDNKWEIWAETPEGGVAVKGKAETEKI